MPITASAPGKIIWIGGYSVLERPNVSFITSVDKRVVAKAEKIDKNNYEINAPQLLASARGKITAGKLNLTNDPKLKFVATALETVLAYLKIKNIPTSGIKIETNSDAAFASGAGKSGLGASAAVTVATTAAVLGCFEPKLSKDKEIVHKLSQISHSTAQGKVGSGFDIAAATYGSCKYVRFSPHIVEKGVAAAGEKWDYQVKKAALPEFFNIIVANIKGKGTSTTELVKKVNQFKEKNPSKYIGLITQLNEANIHAISDLIELKKARGEKADEKLLEKFHSAFENGRKITKQLGQFSGAEIESDEMSELIEDSKSNGALVAKLPGAGGGDSIAALCTSNEDADNLRKFWGTNKTLQVLDVNVDNRGYLVG